MKKLFLCLYIVFFCLIKEGSANVTLLMEKQILSDYLGGGNALFLLATQAFYYGVGKLVKNIFYDIVGENVPQPPKWLKRSVRPLWFLAPQLFGWLSYRHTALQKSKGFYSC